MRVQLWAWIGSKFTTHVIILFNELDIGDLTSRVCLVSRTRTICVWGPLPLQTLFENVSRWKFGRHQMSLKIDNAWWFDNFSNWIDDYYFIGELLSLIIFEQFELIQSTGFSYTIKTSWYQYAPGSLCY